MSYHHHTDERARGPVNDGRQLPSFRDLVAFRSHNPSFRADEGLAAARSQRKEYVVEQSPRQHLEESFEIVGVKRASAPTPRLDTVQPHPHPRYDRGYHEQTPPQPEKVLPAHERQRSGQLREHQYFSPHRYAGPQLPHVQRQSDNANHASQVNGRERAEYRSEREAVLLHRHESRQDPGRSFHPQYHHDARRDPPRSHQESASIVVEQANGYDQVRHGYRKEEIHPRSVADVDPRRRESSVLQDTLSVQARPHSQRNPPQYLPALKGEQTPATRQEIKIDSERTGSVTTLNDLRRLRNDNNRPRHAPTDAHRSEMTSHSTFQRRDDARHEIIYQPQVHRRQAEIDPCASHQQSDQVESHQRHRLVEYDHRAVETRDRADAGYGRASHPLSRSQVYGTSTHGRVQEKAPDSHHRLDQDGSKHVAPDRAPRTVYPPLPPLSSSNGLRQAPSQSSSAPTRMQTPDAFVRPRPPSNGHSMHRPVSQSQRPTDAAPAVADFRHQARLDEPRHMPHHPPHSRDQRPPSTSLAERRNGRGDPHHPVVASQHTGARPGVEANLQKSSDEMHAPSRSFKRQRAGSDTSLVLKSTRLTVNDAEAATFSRVMLPTRQSEQ